MRAPICRALWQRLARVASCAMVQGRRLYPGSLTLLRATAFDMKNAQRAADPEATTRPGTRTKSFGWGQSPLDSERALSSAFAKALANTGAAA